MKYNETSFEFLILLFIIQRIDFWRPLCHTYTSIVICLLLHRKFGLVKSHFSIIRILYLKLKKMFFGGFAV